jgi:hypothetical protein
VRNSLLEELHALENKYGNIESTDGQTWSTLDFLREILWKSGGKFTSAQEHSFQTLKAYERLKLNNLGKPYSAEEKARDRAILEPFKDGNGKYNLDQNLAAKSVVKPIHSGYQVDSNELTPVLIKTSAMPLTLYALEGTRFEDIYVSMLKNNTQLLTTPSAIKIGIPEGVANIINSDGTTKDISELKSLTLRTRDFGLASNLSI